MSSLERIQELLTCLDPVFYVFIHEDDSLGFLPAQAVWKGLLPLFSLSLPNINVYSVESPGELELFEVPNLFAVSMFSHRDQECLVVQTFVTPVMNSTR